MILTPKETGLLKDLTDQEKLCIDKYKRHAAEAHDGQLKALFTAIASVEQGHLTMLNEISAGRVPEGASAVSIPSEFTAVYPQGNLSTPEKAADAYLCSDLLATEKHAAGLYNTCVFEFGQTQLRGVLNRIQTDEQKHGEQLYKYMKTNGMYG